MLVVFPQRFLDFNYSPLRFESTEYIHYGIFTTVSNLYHGGFQLWNGYDQMPLAYYYLGGVMQVNHVITALLFPVLEPFFDDTSKYFYKHSVVFYYVTMAVLRPAGLYLFARLFTQRPSTAVVATVIGTTIVSPMVYYAFTPSPLYSLFPLIAFFIVRLFTFRKATDALLAFLTLIVAISSDPIVGLQYFYLGVHVLLLSCLIWFFLIQREPLLGQPGSISGIDWPRFLKGATGTLALVAVMIGPWIYLLFVNYFDYEFAHETSRFANPVSILGYFGRDTFGARPEMFFARALDFSHNEAAFDWLYVGWAFVFFSICGVILAKDSRKYIFVLCIVSFWALQLPRSPFVIPHLLNALTNPFSGTLRAFHMTGAFLLPAVAFPLFIMGVDAVRDRLADPDARREPIRTALILAGIAVFTVGFLAWKARHAVETTHFLAIAYVVVFAGLATVFVIALHFRWITVNRLRPLALALFGLVLLADFAGYHVYLDHFAKNMTIKTHVVEGIPDNVNPVALDFQNPSVLPVREHYAVEPIGQVEFYISNDPNNMQGLFFRYTNLGKFFKEPHIYKPRHKSYAPLAYDETLQEYLRRDTRIAFLADVGVRTDAGTLERILDAGLDRRIVVVDQGANPAAASGLPTLELALATLPRAAPESSVQWRTLFFSLSEAIAVNTDDDGNRHYTFDLPNEFPPALTSTVFTRDRDNIAVTVGGTPLIPAQGWLARPLQYDLQNIHKGRLMLSLSADRRDSADTEVTLRYRFETPLNPESVWNNQPDALGFTFTAERDGWMVLHYPYDEKWRITVNSEPSPHFRINGAFLGVPVKEGTNRLLIEYWPDSPVRWLIPLSVALNIATLIGLFMIGYRRREFIHVQSPNRWFR